MSLNGNGVATLTCALVFGLLATVAVGLRAVAVQVTTKRYRADDWWILVTLVLHWVWTAVCIWGIYQGGGGIDVRDPTFQFEKYETYLSSLMILLGLGLISLTACKISILMYYRRIFTTRTFKRVTFWVMLATGAWSLTAILGGMLSCLPFDKFWKPWKDGYCINVNVYFLCIEVLETLLDICVLVLPIRMVVDLHTSKRNKIMLSFIFLLGSFVIISGIVRLAKTYVPGDFYLSLTNVVLWSTVHNGVAIICACLPTLRPLIRASKPVLTRYKTSFQSRFKSQSQSHGEHERWYIQVQPEKKNERREGPSIARVGPPTPPKDDRHNSHGRAIHLQGQSWTSPW